MSSITGASKVHRLSLLKMMKAPDEARDEILDQFVRLAARRLGIPGSFVSVVDEEQQTIMAARNFDLRTSSRENAFCRHVVESGEPLVVSDTLLHPDFVHHPLTTGAPYIRFYAGVPLRHPDGFVPGTLCVTDTRPHLFSAQQVHSLSLLAEMVMSFLHAWHRAGLTDAVTGLPDRQRLVRDLQQLAAQGDGRPRRLVLIDCLDMSRARELVRSLGTHAVEGLLRDIALLIPLRLRPAEGERLYTFSAGRFALLTHDGGRLSAGRVSTLLHGISADPGDNMSLELLPVTGESAFIPGPGAGQTAIAQALTALTEAITRGLPSVRFDLPGKATQSFSPEPAELADAVRTGRGLSLLFQPRLSMETGLPVALEARVEWSHPQQGTLSPRILITSGIAPVFLHLLTEWTLEQVISQLQRWHDTCITLPVSVPVSEHDIAMAGFADALRHRMKKARLPRTLLNIECLTPDSLADNPAALEGFGRLREHGFNVSLDGLNAASGDLDYLLRIPPAVVTFPPALRDELSPDAASRIRVRGIIRLLEAQDYHVLTRDEEPAGDSAPVNGYFSGRALPAEALQSWLHWKLRDNCRR
ncbi:sensor domain-containing phosphodiesterase [Erwinia billingiae]|uniref:EAL domain-containing protein n=1 Tax=Erwinia billingiae TaxID=182337 RepID=UPI0019D1C506|nr:EAL domain-containing protein [Erwinia billingiae]MBN7124784.1 sensor domain-containing phosphodiesterase [Erwinia billingiae]